jgi:hypothetical protein
MGNVFKIIALVCDVGFFQTLISRHINNVEKQKTIKKQRLTTYPGLKIWRNFFTHISLSIVFSQHG